MNFYKSKMLSKIPKRKIMAVLLFSTGVAILAATVLTGFNLDSVLTPLGLFFGIALPILSLPLTGA